MDFDVVIVGASSAGLRAAELLADRGAAVGVFERQRALEPERRTYIITAGLERVMDPVPSDLILHQISRLAVEAEGEEAAISLQDPDLVMERSMLRQALAGRARQAGAALRLGHEFRGFEHRGGQTTLQFQTPEQESLQVRAGTVIGADGAYSQVARAAGIARPAVVPLMQAEIKLPGGWQRGVTKVWFDVVDTRYFFWLIPESNDRAVVGLIGEPGKDIKGVLERFLEQRSFRPLGMQSGQAAMHHPRLQPWGQAGDVEVLLVGDAAGQVKVTTVGGTVTGFWGAEAAAEAIVQQRPYGQTLGPLKKELDLHWRIRSLLEKMDNRGYERLLSYLSPGVKRFLAKYDRDGMRSHFWKLPLIQPRFIPMGVKLLLKSPNHQPLPHSQDR